MTSKAAKFFSKLVSKIIWLVSILLILFVLLLSIVKVSLPYWLKQKESITKYVESYIGGDLDFQSMQVDWTEFHPTIMIKDLRWSSDDKNLIVHSWSNTIQLNVWKTLYYGDPVTNEVELDKVNIKVTQNSAPDFTEQFSLENFKANLVLGLKKFRHQYIELTDTNIEFLNTRSFKQSIPLLVYKHEKSNRQLFLDTLGDLTAKGRLVIESQDEFDSKDNRVQYYANFQQTNLAVIAEQFELNNIADFAEINLELWAEQDFSGINSGRLEVSNDASEEAHLDLKLNLGKENNYYQIASDVFNISIGKDGVYENHQSYLRLSHDEQNDKSSYQLETGVVPVGLLTKLILPFVSGYGAELLLNSNPSGIVQESLMVFGKQADSFVPLQGKAVLRDLKFKAYSPVPGVSFDQLEIIGFDGLWSLKAKSKDSSLDWRPMLKSVVDFDALEIGASFNARNDKSIQVENLHFSNSDATVNARANLSLAEQFAMAIYAEASEVDIGKLHLYWPRNPGLKPKTLKYLDESLIAGKVPFAKFIWQGDAEAFPFKQKQGQFDIQAEVANATFKFQPDWPAAEQLYAKASFENEAIIINATRGELEGISVGNAQAVLPDLKKDDLDLAIKIQADTDYSSYRNVYTNSPLQQMLGEELVDINFDKTLSVDLNLDFILSDDVETKIEGLIDFSGNTISGIPYRVELNDTQGRLRFTEQGAIAKGIKADYLNSPLTIDLKVEEFTDNDSLLQIDAKGQIDLSAASSQVLGYSPLIMSGSSHFDLHYEVDGNDESTESFILRSKLLGTKIEGPDWLAKETSNEAEFLTTLIKVNDDLSLRILYKDQMSAQISYNTNNSEDINGLIRVGDLATQTFEAPDDGVVVEGYFDRIDFSEWTRAFNFETSGDDTWPSWIKHVNITTPSLQVAGQEFTKVRINDARTSEQEMRLNLYSEQARANIAYYKDGRKKIIIENLDMQLQPFKGDSEMSDLIKIPLIEYDNWLLECRLCKINGYAFGPVTLASKFENGDITIKGDAFVSNQLSSNIRGVISDDNTQLEVDFSIPNPNGLLRFWELEGEIRDTETKAKLNLNWPGRLLDFSLSQTDGYFNLESKAGSIKDLSDRKARIFSLFSLQSIPRRLSLDFSDIFSDGFFYDKIVGEFTIENGVLISKKTEITGTAADVSVTGSIDLNNQTVAQNVVVTPKLGSSLPVLAGWAIEPTTGLLMLIVSKIFEPALNVVSSIEYKITGPLEDPLVEEVSKKSKEIKLSDEQIEVEKQKLEADQEQVQQLEQVKQDQPEQKESERPPEEGDKL